MYQLKSFVVLCLVLLNRNIFGTINKTWKGSTLHAICEIILFVALLWNKEFWRNLLTKLICGPSWWFYRIRTFFFLYQGIASDLDPKK